MTIEKYKPYLIFTPLCVLCGGIVAYTLMPFYIAADVIRQFGLAKHSSTTLTVQDVIVIGWVLMGYGLVQGPFLYFLRERVWLSLVIFLAIGQWFIAIPAAILATAPEGLWYRGFLNGLVFLSLPVAHWLLSLGVLRLLQRRGL